MTKITEQTKTILNCFNNSRLNINNNNNFGVWSKLKQKDFLRPLWWHNAGEDESKTSRFNKKKRKKNFLLFLSLLFLRCNPKREINYFYFCFPPFNQHLLLNRLLQTIWHTNDVTIRPKLQPLPPPPPRPPIFFSFPILSESALNYSFLGNVVY